MIHDLAYMVLKSEEECERFIKWAFGDSECFPLCDLMEKWNNLHGDLYKLNGDNSVVKDMVKMLNIWQSITYEEKHVDKKQEDTIE